MTDLVWYTAYGSNLCESRFMAYINGSDGSLWPKTRGCRDKTRPIKNRTGTIPGKIYFAEHSKNWDDGGVAFYDPTVKNSTTFVRMYLVTLDQFNDIFLQENGLDDGDITAIVSQLTENSGTIYGTGWYREILRLPDVDGHPALTFTSPVRTHGVELVAPSQSYLDVIEIGLKECKNLGKSEIAAYLKSLPTSPSSNEKTNPLQ